MVIGNGDLGGAEIGPAENDAPLVVDADGMPAGPVAPEQFEAITRRDAEVVQLAGAVHLDQLAQGHPTDGREAPVLFLVEKLLGVGIGKGLNHALRWTRNRPKCAPALAARAG